MTLYLGNQKVSPTRTINGGGERYLIQASDESMLPDWYRIYSDGWCEQGGVATIDFGNMSVEVTFLFEYKSYNYDYNYSVRVTPCEYNASLTINPVGAWRGLTGIKIMSTTSGSYRNFSWETKGFIDLSQLEESEE